MHRSNELVVGHRPPRKFVQVPSDKRRSAGPPALPFPLVARKSKNAPANKVSANSEVVFELTRRRV